MFGILGTGAKKAFILTSPEQSRWTENQNKALKDLIPSMVQAFRTRINTHGLTVHTTTHEPAATNHGTPFSHFQTGKPNHHT